MVVLDFDVKFGPQVLAGKDAERQTAVLLLLLLGQCGFDRAELVEGTHQLGMRPDVSRQGTNVGKATRNYPTNANI